MFNIVFVQSMAELLAENLHNIWARKKKIELEAKGKSKTTHPHTVFSKIFFFCCHHHQLLWLLSLLHLDVTKEWISVPA